MKMFMRNYILLTCLLLFGGLAQAQPILTSADIGAIGTEFYLGIDTNLTGITEGAAGANQTWDFSGLDADIADTIRFLDPAMTPYGTDFPSSTLAIFQATLGGYAYLEATTSYLDLIGLAGDPAGLGETFVIPQTDPLRVAAFPFTYGDSFSDVAVLDIRVEAGGIIPLADSIRYQSTSNRVLEGDAYGTLDLFSATYNSLRVKEVSMTFDSIWAHVPFFGWNLVQDTSYTDSTFTWWDNTKGYYLAEASYTGGVLTSITYQDPNIVSAAPALALDFAVYPNPGQDFVRVERDKVAPAKLFISDVQGRILIEEALLQKVEEVDLKGLSPGVYLLRIEDQKGQFLGSERLVIQ